MDLGGAELSPNSVSADVVLAGDEDYGGLGLARAMGKGVEQAKYGGVGDGNSEGNGSRDGEGDYKSD